ncbi:hypothetical protein MRB53_031123 [Persea americana]|uniref:Uncharacterized protein n=1 Tax=Persea americana TaxID=3435 RepID=A0ACC2KN27_PERAE|nr:hypothetical protein MRB53_031123 [Persea americana]
MKVSAAEHYLVLKKKTIFPFSIVHLRTHRIKSDFIHILGHLGDKKTPLTVIHELLKECSLYCWLSQ